MANPTRYPHLLAVTLVAATGFLAGIAYRAFVDSADERELAYYIRSGLHGVGIGLAAWAVQNALAANAQSSLASALRRLPLLGEVVVRSLLMTVAIVIAG